MTTGDALIILAVIGSGILTRAMLRDLPKLWLKGGVIAPAKAPEAPKDSRKDEP